MALTRSIGAIAALFVSTVALACEMPMIDLYRTAACARSSGWAENLRDNGFEVTTHNVADLSAKRAELGIAGRQAGCHLAVIEGYVVEGNVPATDIARLLEERPQARGLSIAGTPGMEGAAAVPYDVLLIGLDGSTRVYARH